MPHAPALAALATIVAASAAHADDAAPAVAVTGYVEAAYQRPTGFALANAVLDVTGTRDRVTARVALQAIGEPAQRATLAIAAPADLTVEAGLFPSPIGLEVFAVKDDWNWSRSTLFANLPAEHVGVQVTRRLGCGWSAVGHVYNGWNQRDDDDDRPSLGGSLVHASDRTVAQVMYLGGSERAPGRWRHLADAYVQRTITDALAVAAHVDAGVEGDDRWAGAALYARVAPIDALAIAVRGDAFTQRGPTPIFGPVRTVASATATLAYQPFGGTSVRLEYRRDHPRRNTVTLGATAWF